MVSSFLRQRGMPSLFRPWSVCFAMVTVVIVTCMMLPQYFGMMKFTQWGAMYTDSWCRVDISSGKPGDDGVQSDVVTASTVGPGAVFSAPMHNYQSCLMWARMVQCGRVMPDGWTVAWARPFFKGQYFLGEDNVCDLPLDPDAEWFRPKL